VDAKRAEMTRLCPKFPCAADPEYVMEFSPSAPMALEVCSITVLASSAAVLTHRSIISSAVAASVLHMQRPVAVVYGWCRSPLTR
jgi:hypothetical protein